MVNSVGLYGTRLVKEIVLYGSIRVKNVVFYGTRMVKMLFNITGWLKNVVRLGNMVIEVFL